MICTDSLGHAVPGPWYGSYLRAWGKAFPGSLRYLPGRFYEEGGSKWASSTPDWDEWWFRDRGVLPPLNRITLRPRIAAR